MNHCKGKGAPAEICPASANEIRRCSPVVRMESKPWFVWRLVCLEDVSLEAADMFSPKLVSKGGGGRLGG